MTAVKKIEFFLKNKMEKNDLKKWDIAQATNLSAHTIKRILTGFVEDVTLNTVLKLANYFECPTDEVFDRNNFIDSKITTFKIVTHEEAMVKIKNFISLQMEKNGLNIYKFAESCNLPREAFVGFIKNKPSHKSIGSNRILALIDTFNVSLDELIGRSKPLYISKETNVDQDLNTQSHNNKSVPQKFSTDLSKLVKKIQEPLKDYLLPNDQISSTHYTPTHKVSTKHKNNLPHR